MIIDSELTSPGVRKLPRISIDGLDDDSLLYIFYLFRPGDLDVDEYGTTMWDWDRERWWYTLVQVCRRWRHLILGSASHLDLCLVCVPGTPVADMLAHSPPLSLVIGHHHPDQELTAEDEEGITLALQHRDRVKCIYLRLPVLSLQKVITAIDGEFPALEYLHIGPPTTHDTRLTLLPTFEAPHLRNLWLTHFASQIGSPLLTNSISLVTLWLQWIHPSTYPHPNDLLGQLSLLPQLERLDISFRSAVPNHDIERQLLDTPVMIHVTQPNLRSFSFEGVSAFLESLLPHMTTPLLETFRVQFFNKFSFSVPRLTSFMMAAEKLRFINARILFCHEAVVVFAYTTGVELSDNFNITVCCRHLDWQVSTMAQLSNALNPLFSEVVDLTLDYRDHTSSSEWHNQADHALWRELLGSFRNVKTLRVHRGLVGELSRSLRLDGEPPLEVLPELKEIVCPVGNIEDQTFASFIREREVASQPVNLIGKPSPVDDVRYSFNLASGISFLDPE
jgi:hypothetical protein